MTQIDPHVALRIAALILERDCAKIGINLALRPDTPWDQEQFDGCRNRHIHATRQLNAILGNTTLIRSFDTLGETALIHTACELATDNIVGFK
jgi:hypothetical protein